MDHCAAPSDAARPQVNLEALTLPKYRASMLRYSRIQEVCMSFQGKSALVTGASRGIGRGIALKLAAGGAQVAIHYYRNKEAAPATLEKAPALGSNGFLVQTDVCRPEEIGRLFQQVRSEFGSLD